jgi:threonine dehydratase
MMDVKSEVLLAEERIRPYVRETFLEHSPFFSRLAEANVFFKLENLQHTGSFKVRGATNKLLALPSEERTRGVVAASTGNHGSAVAFASQRIDVPSVVFMPETALPGKIQALESSRAEVRLSGQDCIEAEAAARRYAAQRGMAYLSPYNDAQVIGGQGTVGLELARQLDKIDAVFVSLGGGGLISGIAGYLKDVQPGVQVFGCSPENSQVMIESVNAGRILDLPSLPTLSDGTAGGVETDSITFELCRRLVDGYVTVTEEEIADSLRLFIETHHMLIEGSAAVAIASLLKQRERVAGKNVVVVLCGANIDKDTLKGIL